MKRIAFILMCTMLLPLGVQAKKKDKIKHYPDCYIYAQSGRNSEKKGSATSLYTGMTYSLENAYNSAGPDDIDLMLYYGKANKANGYRDKVFHFFAPNDPGAVIDWEKDGGTTPYCKFEGKSDNPDSYFALKNWKEKNATKMQRVTDVDFFNATYESLDSLKVENNYMISDIKVGDIIAFELASTHRKAGKKGLLVVKFIKDDETKPEKAGQGQYQQIVFDIKVQK